MNQQGQIEVAQVVKTGENCIYVVIDRCPAASIAKAGYQVSVTANIAVEEFFRGLGDGSVQLADTWSRGWLPIPKDGPPVTVYNLGQPIRSDDYRIDRPGAPLILPETNEVNLSFLRIPGISDGMVTFGVRGVIAFDQLRDVKSRVQSALGQFYKSYVRPVSLSVRVSTSSEEMFT